VIYMPGHDYAAISSRLTTSGFAAETPCAIISRATTPQQQVHRTTISHLPRAPKLAAPTLLVVGDVVKFADRPAYQIEANLPDMETALAQSLTSLGESNQEETLS